MTVYVKNGVPIVTPWGAAHEVDASAPAQLFSADVTIVADSLGNLRAYPTNTPPAGSKVILRVRDDDQVLYGLPVEIPLVISGTTPSTIDNPTVLGDIGPSGNVEIRFALIMEDSLGRRSKPTWADLPSFTRTVTQPDDPTDDQPTFQFSSGDWLAGADDDGGTDFFPKAQILVSPTSPITEVRLVIDGQTAYDDGYDCTFSTPWWVCNFSFFNETPIDFRLAFKDADHTDWSLLSTDTKTIDETLIAQSGGGDPPAYTLQPQDIIIDAIDGGSSTYKPRIQIQADGLTPTSVGLVPLGADISSVVTTTFTNGWWLRDGAGTANGTITTYAPVYKAAGHTDWSNFFAYVSFDESLIDVVIPPPPNPLTGPQWTAGAISLQVGTYTPMFTINGIAAADLNWAFNGQTANETDWFPCVLLGNDTNGNVAFRADSVNNSHIVQNGATENLRVRYRSVPNGQFSAQSTTTKGFNSGLVVTAPGGPTPLTAGQWTIQGVIIDSTTFRVEVRQVAVSMNTLEWLTAGAALSTALSTGAPDGSGWRILKDSTGATMAFTRGTTVSVQLLYNTTSGGTFSGPSDIKPQTVAGTGGGGPNLWTPLPIREQLEQQQGKVGGEGRQFMQAACAGVAQPNRIYSLLDNGPGLLYSDDFGLSWIWQQSKGLRINASHGMNCDPVDANIINAVLYDSIFPYSSTGSNWGMYRSVDGGLNWTFTNNVPSLTHNRALYRTVAYDRATIGSANAPNWICTVYGPNLCYRSTNNGQSWSSIGSTGSGSNGLTYCVESDPLTSGKFYFGCDDGLHTATGLITGSLTIGVRDSGLPTGRVKSIQAENVGGTVHLFATVDNQGFYHKTGSGAWVLVRTSSSSDQVCAVAATDPLNYQMHVGQDQASYTRRTINGSAFTTISVSPRPGWTDNISYDAQIITGAGLGIAGGVVFYHRTDKQKVAAFGLPQWFNSTDGGANWVENGNGFTGLTARWSGPNPIQFDHTTPTKMGLAFHDECGAFSSTGGSFFTRIHPPFQQTSFSDTNPVQGKIAHANSTCVTWPVGSWASGSIPSMVIINLGIPFFYKIATLSGGSTWKLWDGTGGTQNLGVNNITAAGSHSTNGNICWIGPYMTNTAGTSFLSMANHFFMAVCPADNVIFACNGAGDTIYRSTDLGVNGGASWTQSAAVSGTINTAGSLPVFAAHPTNSDIIVCRRLNDLYQYKWSTQTWTRLPISDYLTAPSYPTGFNSPGAVVFDPVDGQTIYVAMEGHGRPNNIFRSIDGGQTWTGISFNSPRAGAMCLNVRASDRRLHGGFDGMGTFWIPGPP